MAEDGEGAESSDSAAVNVALNASGASEEARDYLRKQSRLADLQIDTLEKKDEFELSHLRFRRFSDYARFALEVAGFLVVLLIVCGLASMVWNASRDHGLVVDAFSVPPDLAQSGLTGPVIANRLMDRYGNLQANSFAVTQGGESYRGGDSGGVRVQIPDTGISLGELQRYLTDWLGHDTHVSGEVVRTPKGYSLTVRYGDQPGVTVEGADLDKLLGQSAEKLMASALPYRYVEYLSRHNRSAEALAMLPSLVATGSAADRGRAYSAWSTVYFFRGDMWVAREKAIEGLRIDPTNGVLLAYLGATEGNLGHDEASLNAIRATLDNFKHNALTGLDPAVVAALPVLFGNYSDDETGDLSAALAGWSHLSDMHSNAFDPAAATTDAAADHDMALARRTAESISATYQGKPNFNIPLEQMYIAFYSGDWAGATRFGKTAREMLEKQADQHWQIAVFVLPYMAEAIARNGDTAGAEALIGKASLDCDICTRARGRIAALKHNWTGAAHWFAMVSARSPHVPFADTDWGAMLMAEGDLDGAIAKFTAANQKGPHFADPLEMWGEALMEKNRSDLALAKFAEAARYAPNWGRLHLKWGEALFYSGDKDDARKQFAIASGLDLSIAEKSELNRMTAHG
jgi:tetratricopeptide (TPR) repeat protein